MTPSLGRIAVTIAGVRQPVDLYARCRPSGRLSKESAQPARNY
jgi:hypothetical protein